MRKQSHLEVTYLKAALVNTPRVASCLRMRRVVIYIYRNIYINIYNIIYIKKYIERNIYIKKYRKRNNIREIDEMTSHRKEDRGWFPHLRFYFEIDCSTISIELISCLDWIRLKRVSRTNPYSNKGCRDSIILFLEYVELALLIAVSGSSSNIYIECKN